MESLEEKKDIGTEMEKQSESELNEEESVQ